MQSPLLDTVRTVAPNPVLNVTLTVAFAIVSAVACAQPMPIPDLEVAGPADGFDMASRLMTSKKRGTVKLTVPGQGSVRLPQFNGTFFYSPANPAATSTLKTSTCAEPAQVRPRSPERRAITELPSTQKLPTGAGAKTPS